MNSSRGVVGALLMCWFVVQLAFSPAAEAQSAERISRFTSKITVAEDGSMGVVESIDYSFGDNQRHGIIRELTTNFAYQPDDPQGGRSVPEGQIRAYLIDQISVSSPSGAPTRLIRTETAAGLSLRIGEPDQTITGPQKYVLKYRVSGAFNRFSQAAGPNAEVGPRDELYWNITGNGWSVPIDEVAVQVTAAKPAMDIRCFQGALGSKTQCAASGTEISDFRARGLAANEGLTILIAYPLNTVSGADPILKSADGSSSSQPETLSPLAIFGAGLLAVLGSLGMVFLVWRRGRDAAFSGLTPGLLPGSQGSPESLVTRHEKNAAVQFTPPAGLRPGELGTLLDEMANPADVTATIVDLAVRGYLRIVEQAESGSPQDWLLQRTISGGPSAAELRRYEVELLAALFRGGDQVLLRSGLRDTFSMDMRRAQENLYHEVTQLKWFRANPHLLRGKYRAWGIGIMAVGFLSTFVFGPLREGLLVYSAAIIIIGLVVLIAARKMPARTALGSAVLAQTFAFRRYLATAEADQLRYEEGQDLFSRYLPYAIIFGLTDRWAKIFSDLARENLAGPEPKWYVGSAFGAPAQSWASFTFGSAISSFAAEASSGLAQTPASSGQSGFSSGSFGGGFSGGGGGGGGGGSW